MPSDKFSTVQSLPPWCPIITPKAGVKIGQQQLQISTYTDNPEHSNHFQQREG